MAKPPRCVCFPDFDVSYLGITFFRRTPSRALVVIDRLQQSQTRATWKSAYAHKLRPDIPGLNGATDRGIEPSLGSANPKASRSMDRGPSDCFQGSRFGRKLRSSACKIGASQHRKACKAKAPFLFSICQLCSPTGHVLFRHAFADSKVCHHVFCV